MTRSLWVGLVLIYFLIAAVLYSPSVTGPWQYDDHAQILDQKVLTGRSIPLLLGSIFRFSAWPDGWTGTRDVVRATFRLNWDWWAMETAGYRWVNLIIHVVNAALVAGLVYLLLRPIPNTEYRILNKKEKDSRIDSTFSIQHSVFSIPAFAGLLFLIHPVQSQAVAYVAQRFTSLAAMFYIATIVCWLVALRTPEQRKRWLWYAGAILGALLSYNSKEITVTLPGALVLVTLFILRNQRSQAQDQNSKNKTNALARSPFRSFMLLIPFLLLAVKIPLQVASSSVRGLDQPHKTSLVISESLTMKQKLEGLTRHDYLLTQFNVVRTYLRLLVSPVRQTLDYDYPLTKDWDMKTVLSLLLHVGLIGIGGWLFLRPIPNTEYRILNKKEKDSRIDSTFSIPRPVSAEGGQHSAFSIPAFASRLVGLGILWFYLTISIESSVIPIIDVIYEHRVYLPFVGFVIALSGVIITVVNSKAYSAHRTSLLVLGGIWMLLLSIGTVRRAWVWGDDVRLWRDIYQKAPNKPRANKNYGVVLAARGEYQQGIERITRAIELEPDNADYWSNLGTAYLRSQLYEEASNKFLHAFELSIAEHERKNIPLEKATAQYMNDYGVTMVQLGRGEEGKVAFQRALEIQPDLYAAHLGLGAAFNLLGDPQGAFDEFSMLVRNNPDQPDAYGNLATILSRAGQHQEALSVLLRLRQVKPDFEGLEARTQKELLYLQGSGN